VPTAYAHHRITVVGTVDTVGVLVGDRVVASHRRRWDREQVTDDPVHYLALAGSRPRDLLLRPGGDLGLELPTAPAPGARD
jgi:hypothetical protein